MSLQAEREFFEKYVMTLDRFKDRRPYFVFMKNEHDEYDNPDVLQLWNCWLASRNREGYVLVPVYMIENAIDPPCDIDKEVAERELLDMIKGVQE